MSGGWLPGPAVVLAAGLLAATGAAGEPPARQPHTYFRQHIGLSDEEIGRIERGKAVTRILDSPDKPQVVVFGAVFVQAPAEAYVERVRAIDRLARGPGYRGGGRLSDPPALGDFEGFTLEPADIEALRKCKVGECDVQLPAATIEDLRRSINWKAKDAPAQVNRRARELMFAGIQLYRAGGLAALGEYRDKNAPARMADDFAVLLSRSPRLPDFLPAFHDYLRDYPAARLEDAEDFFYWEKVEFGLKPTLRANHATIYRPPGAEPLLYAIAIKQLYASHYFRTALDLSFCVADSADPARGGFFLVTLKGSRQDGLTGLKGAVTRGVVLSKTAAAMERSLDGLAAELRSANGGP